MADGPDTNAEIWKSDAGVAAWSAEAGERERNRVAHRQFLGRLLPFGPQDEFTFLDLGAGTGAASRAILQMYPSSTAVLADFSPQMMDEGAREMAPFAGRYHYAEVDLSAGEWTATIPATVDAVITSLVVHHLPDERKRTLFAEIFARLVPGGWYLNYDPVSAGDPAVEAAWQRVNDRLDPEAAAKRMNRTPHEQARWQNHVRYIIPLEPQLEYLRAAGFGAVDVYWKQLDYVIYGGCRPAS